MMGGCLGSWLAIKPAATASYFGTKDYAKNYGIVFTASGIGAVVGGIVSAQAKNITGAYQPLNEEELNLALLSFFFVYHKQY